MIALFFFMPSILGTSKGVVEDGLPELVIRPRRQLPAQAVGAMMDNQRAEGRLERAGNGAVLKARPSDLPRVDDRPKIQPDRDRAEHYQNNKEQEDMRSDPAWP